MTDMWCIMADLRAAILSQQGSSAEADRMKSLAEGAHAEVQQGSYVEQPIRVVVGRLRRSQEEGVAELDIGDSRSLTSPT